MIFIDNGLVICESPNIIAERPKLRLNTFKSGGIVYNRCDFRTGLEHTLGLHNPVDVAFTIRRDCLNIKVIKAASNNVTFI